MNTIYTKSLSSLSLSQNFLSRFKTNKNWSKILFRGDRKLQTTEIVEIQELLNDQIDKVFNTLYNFYTVTRGCKIVVGVISDDRYICSLTDGQVYLKPVDCGGTFIDVGSFNFNASRIKKTFIGLNFKLEIEDNYLNKNPHSGSFAFGSSGSPRLIAKTSIVVKDLSLGQEELTELGNFYPLAIIKPKSLEFTRSSNDPGDGYPDIYYYRNEELSKVYNDNIFSTNLKKSIELNLHEASGNFISSGFYISFNLKFLSLNISPGIAYIDGVRVETNYIESYRLKDIKVSNLIYIAYINKYGEFGVVKNQNDSPYLNEPPTGSINLGILYFKGHKNNDSGYDYTLVSSKNRMPSIQELILLEKDLIRNKKEIANLTLQIDASFRALTVNNALNGVLADSFNDLNKSDIFNPLFRASILPGIQAISLPFISYPKNNRTFIIDKANNSSIQLGVKQNGLNEEVYYWAGVASSRTILIAQEAFNTLIELEVFNPANVNNETLSLFASPNLVYKSDRDTLINYSDPKILNLIYENIGNTASSIQELVASSLETVTIDSPINNNLIQSQNVIVEGAGFPSSQDNIRVFLNDVPLSNLKFINGIGSPGSFFATVKASISGKVKFSFDLPASNSREVFDLRLSDGTHVATTRIQIEDPEINRIKREASGSYLLRSPVKYSTLASGIAQTFLSDSDAILAEVDLAVSITNLNLFNNLDETADILTVQIVNTVGGDRENTPTDEAIVSGTLYKKDFNEAAYSKERLGNATSIWSNIKFDKPALIKQALTYAIIVSSSISGISLQALKPQDSTTSSSGFARKVGYLNGNLLTRFNVQGWNSHADLDLAFRLIAFKPNFISSSFNLEVRNPEKYNILDLNLCLNLSPNSSTRVSVLDNGIYKPLINGVHYYGEPVDASQIRIECLGNINTHPTIDLDNTVINLISNNNKGIWTSINYEFASGYNFLDLSVDLFKPNNAKFNIYISSNKGLLWEEITKVNNEGNEQYLNSVTEKNRLIPIKSYNYSVPLSTYVQLDNQDVPRKNLIVRIDMEVSDLTNIPFFKNLIVLTY